MTDSIRLVEDQGGQPPLPNNVEAEAALLGALMIENSIAGHIDKALTADHFYEPLHRRIFTAIQTAIEAGRIATPITLRPLFEADATMGALGGPSYLAQLTGNSAAIIGARDFADQIIALAKLRKLVTVFDAARAAALDTSVEVDIEALVATVDDELSAAVDRVDVHKNRSIARIWDETMAGVDEIIAGKPPVGLKIDGLDDWNSLLGRMRKGNLIILAGRPGMGKTAVANAVGICAARAGIPTDFFSLEMSEEELMERTITDVCYDRDRGSFTYDQLQKGRLNPFQRRLIDEARQTIDEWPLRYHCPPNSRVGAIIAEMRLRQRAAVKRGKPIGLFILDYLGLMAGEASIQNKAQEIADITGRLKHVAREMGAVILLCCQLSRKVEEREDKRPVLSDLRDSGSIEQDADAVVFVYREQYYLESNPPLIGSKKYNDWEESLAACRDRLDLIAAKVRKGKTGVRKCFFFGSHQAVRGSKFFSGAN